MGPYYAQYRHDDNSDVTASTSSGISRKRVKKADGFYGGGIKRVSAWQKIQRKVFELLESKAICPLEGIKYEQEFLNDDDLTDPDNSVRVNKAIEVWSHKINDFTLRNFFEMYGKFTTFKYMPPVYNSLLERTFACLKSNFEEDELDIILNQLALPKIHYKEKLELNSEGQHLLFSKSKRYYNLEESYNVMNRLLKFQFNDDVDKIKDFLQCLVNVIDKQPEDNPKSNIKNNAFLVISPPSGGKNFFFDTILQLCLNFGQLGTANKNNNFAFQDAANRRIILWNEPNYEQGLNDYLKTLFEGGDTKVRIKMMGDAHIKRTPILVLTNNEVNFMADTTFKDRLKQYRWKAAPFLKDYKLKPYPLAFFELLLKYEIKF